MATAAESRTTEASSHSAAVIIATLRLPNQSHARKKRDPIEFSFNNLIFLSLCVVVFEVDYFVGLMNTSREKKRFACDPSGLRRTKNRCGRNDVAGLRD